jgi:hypothetical protein
MRTCEAMADWLRRQCERGLIEFADVRTAAGMLRGMMIAARRHPRRYPGTTRAERPSPPSPKRSGEGCPPKPRRRRAERALPARERKPPTFDSKGSRSRFDQSERYGSFSRLSLRRRCFAMSPVVQYSPRTARSASTLNSSGHCPSE